MSLKPSRAQFLVAVRNCRRFIKEENFSEARDLGLDIIRRADAAGVPAIQAHWFVAVAADNLGDLIMAARHIVKAALGDPLALDVENSRAVVFTHVRERVAEAPEGNPEVPGLYEVLLEADEADVASHLAWARHLKANGAIDRSIELLDAVVALHPNSAEAWTLMETIARTAGRGERAVEAAARLAGLHGGREVSERTQAWAQA